MGPGKPRALWGKRGAGAGDPTAPLRAMVLVLPTGLTLFGLMHLTSRGNVCAPRWARGIPGGGDPLNPCSGRGPRVARPRIPNLLLLTRVPSTPNAEPMVKFCPRTAPVLGPDLRLLYNNGNNRALLSASSIMPGVLSVFGH